MQRFLIALGVLFLLAGILWPWLSRLPFGRLPGDISIVKAALRAPARRHLDRARELQLSLSADDIDHRVDRPFAADLVVPQVVRTGPAADILTARPTPVFCQVAGT